MADNLSKGSKDLKGKGGTLDRDEAVKVRPKNDQNSNASEGSTPKVGQSKINESGKGSGGR